MSYVLGTDARLRVVHALCEDKSINATVRQTGVSKPTILKLLVQVGTGCARSHNRLARQFDSALIECDETWSYVGKKEKRTGPGDPRGWGEAYTFVGLDVSSRFVLSYLVGRREIDSTDRFIKDLRSRVRRLPQINTDGLASPDVARWSTSHVEPQDLVMRMHIRRLTRLCNGFSKKFDNHCAAVALHFQHYNWVKVHDTLKTTPAVAAGLARRPLSVAEMIEIALAEEESAPPVPVALSLPAAPPAREEGAQVDLWEWLAAQPAKASAKPIRSIGAQLGLFDNEEWSAP